MGQSMKGYVKKNEDGQEFQVISDGRTVWVNSEDGCCVGRFSKTGGIDIHHDSKGQTEGKHCLDCKIGVTDNKGWGLFINGILKHYGVKIKESYQPINIIKQRKEE